MTTAPMQSQWRAYIELCKPRVVALMLLTAVVGMLLATPWQAPWYTIFYSIPGIALAASAGAAINHVIDRHIDAVMRRTSKRPIPQGIVTPQQATFFAMTLGISGIMILICCVNALTAILTFATLIGYAAIYTIFLKHTTPQNIVIGGLAGAMPPLLGWTAVTGHITAAPLLLVLIIFAWTPPHFWALCIYRYEDYQKANIPMLPVTHGIPFTKLCILLYTVLLGAISLLPFAINMSGVVYLIGICLLNMGFIYWAVKLMLSHDPSVALYTFQYSIIYLMALFLIVLMDHYIPIYRLM